MPRYYWGDTRIGDMDEGRQRELRGPPPLPAARFLALYSDMTVGDPAMTRAPPISAFISKAEAAAMARRRHDGRWRGRIFFDADAHGSAAAMRCAAPPAALLCSRAELAGQRYLPRSSAALPCRCRTAMLLLAAVLASLTMTCSKITRRRWAFAVRRWAIIAEA